MNQNSSMFSLNYDSISCSVFSCANNCQSLVLKNETKYCSFFTGQMRLGLKSILIELRVK